MASSSTPIVNTRIGQAIFEKLIKANHALWKASHRHDEGCASGGLIPYRRKQGPTLMVKEKQGDKEVDVPNLAYGE